MYEGRVLCARCGRCMEENKLYSEGAGAGADNHSK